MKEFQNQLKSRGKKQKVDQNLQNAQVMFGEISKCLQAFQQILDLKIHYLWPDLNIEEEFINLFLYSGFDLLENKNIVKNDHVKMTLFAII